MSGFWLTTSTNARPMAEFGAVVGQKLCNHTQCCHVEGSAGERFRSIPDSSAPLPVLPVGRLTLCRFLLRASRVADKIKQFAKYSSEENELCIALGG